MNISEIKTVQEAKNLITQLEKRILVLEEEEKLLELWENGIQEKLSYQEILKMEIGEQYYLVAQREYPEKGSVIPIQVAAMREIDQMDYYSMLRIDCLGISSNLRKMDKWYLVNRPAFNYCLEIFTHPVEMVRLLEPIIYSNVDNLLIVEIYRIVDK